MIEQEKFLHAHRSGLTDRAMSKLFNLHHKTIANYRKKYNLLPNGTQRTSLKLTTDNQAKCSKCFLEKDISEFTVHGKKLSYCMNCRTVQQEQLLNSSIERFLQDRHNRLILRCKANSVTCTITRNELIMQYKQQKGKCFYTDVVLEWGVGKGLQRNTLSIDKIIPDRGYIKGNVVLCSHKANTIKSDLSFNELRDWLPGWHKRILEFMTIANLQSAETQ